MPDTDLKPGIPAGRLDALVGPVENAPENPFRIRLVLTARADAGAGPCLAAMREVLEPVTRLMRAGLFIRGGDPEALEISARSVRTGVIEVRAEGAALHHGLVPVLLRVVMRRAGETVSAIDVSLEGGQRVEDRSREALLGPEAHHVDLGFDAWPGRAVTETPVAIPLPMAERASRKILWDFLAVADLGAFLPLEDPDIAPRPGRRLVCKPGSFGPDGTISCRDVRVQAFYLAELKRALSA